MNTDEHRLDVNQITKGVIGCAYKVSNTLGCGFLESVYQNAMLHEIRKSGLRAEPQREIKVIYDGVVVGDYYADILVEDVLIVELKAVKALDEIYSAQCLNYLKASGLKVCLLMNFGKPRVDVRRFVF